MLLVSSLLFLLLLQSTHPNPFFKFISIRNLLWACIFLEVSPINLRVTFCLRFGLHRNLANKRSFWLDQVFQVSAVSLPSKHQQLRQPSKKGCVLAGHTSKLTHYPGLNAWLSCALRVHPYCHNSLCNWSTYSYPLKCPCSKNQIWFLVVFSFLGRRRPRKYS